MSDIITKIKIASISKLNLMVGDALASVEREVVDQIGDFKNLTQQTDTVINRFAKLMGDNFDELMDVQYVRTPTVFNFETLSLVQDEELEVIVALEGMINAARNEHLALFIGFNTRLGSLFPRKRINESNNPLDPDQIAIAFQEAIRPNWVGCTKQSLNL